MNMGEVVMGGYSEVELEEAGQIYVKAVGTIQGAKVEASALFLSKVSYKIRSTMGVM